MIHSRNLKENRRRGRAVVELAVLLPLLTILLVGVWEVGRMVEVEQHLNNAVREGGRQASRGTKNAAAVQTDVVNYLANNGITATTSMVTVTNLTSSSRNDPTQGQQLDHYQVSISLPFNNVKWIVLNKVITNAQNLTASADWYSMLDLPLTVSQTIPLQ